MTTVAAINHIRIDKDGVAWVGDTCCRVSQVAVEHLTHGWSPEEISFQHSGSITLGQAYAALSYFYDHVAEIDEQIRGEKREVAEWEKTLKQPDFRKRLRAPRRRR
jgi:uncharacterized protein (DUF433 family)